MKDLLKLIEEHRSLKERNVELLALIQDVFLLAKDSHHEATLNLNKILELEEAFKLLTNKQGKNN